MTLQRRHLLGALAPFAAPSPPLAATPTAASAAVPLRVVASFSILADWLRELGGAALKVETLVGPDADAHVFSPRPSDAHKLAQAELIAFIGQGFESWMPRLIRASASQAPVVLASQGLPLRRGSGHVHNHGHGPAAADPHFWHDPNLVRQALGPLRAALSRARPADAALFLQRHTDYDTQLLALHREVQALLEPITPERRRVITDHDAFAYFGAAYGVHFMAPRGLNTEAQASAASVARLISQIRRSGARAVFVENISDPRLVQRIAAEAGVPVGGRLYSDALSAPGGEAGSYLQLIRHNARAIARALQGEQS